MRPSRLSGVEVSAVRYAGRRSTRARRLATAGRRAGARQRRHGGRGGTCDVDLDRAGARRRRRCRRESPGCPADPPHRREGVDRRETELSSYEVLGGLVHERERRPPAVAVEGDRAALVLVDHRAASPCSARSRARQGAPRCCRRTDRLRCASTPTRRRRARTCAAPGRRAARTSRSTGHGGRWCTRARAARRACQPAARPVRGTRRSHGPRRGARRSPSTTRRRCANDSPRSRRRTAAGSLARPVEVTADRDDPVRSSAHGPASRP